MEVTDLIGGSGNYQNMLLLLAMYRGMMLAINNLCASFLFPDVDHWCARPPDYAEWSVEDWKRAAIPRASSGTGYDSCTHYAITDYGVFDNSSVVSCSSWEYDRSKFWPSGTEMWNLVCGSAWMNALPQSSYMAGLTAAFAVLGPLSDMYGRRPVMLGGILSYIILGYLLALTSALWLFCVLRFFIAIAVAAANNSMTLYVESVGPNHRALSMVAYGVFWGVGIMALAGLVLIMPKWQTQLATFATLYFFPLVFWSYIVESPKWLLTVGKYKEADEAIRKIAKMNGRKDITEEDLSRLRNKYKEQHRNREAKGWAGIKALFTSRTMINFTATNAVFQLCTALVRYQLALDTGLLPINPYYNFLIGGSIEVVSGVACLFILWYLPRKCSTIVFMVSTMASYVLHACLPKEYNITESILMLAGRLCIGNVININIIYLSEVFPTNVRALATGVAQTIFGVGGVIQPFLNQPFNHGTWDAVFYAIVMLLATLVVFPWPETKGRPLPDFVENVEASASSSTSGSFANNSNDTGDIVVHYNPAYKDNQEGASVGAVDTNKYWNSLSEYTSTAITMEVPSFDQGSGVWRSSSVNTASRRGGATNVGLKREHTL
ncbi:solute carrier family 22 member 6-B [Rhipicephalus microplus]|uniref:solute carrier family 22 member 6-B n=1 Tax=Rhipicephalus microplus TaxID=6941 RepID=UPI003F6B0E43